MLFSDAADIDRHTSSQAEPLIKLLKSALAYKVRLAALAVVGLLLTGVVLCFIPPTYQAEAVVIVDSRRNKLADDESALSSIVIDQYQTSLKSELELVLSADLARHVIETIGLLDTPEYLSARRHVPTAVTFASWRRALTRAATVLFGRIGVHIDNAPSSQVWSPPAGVAIPVDNQVMENAVKIFQRSFSAVNDPKSLTIRMSYRSGSPQLAAAVTNAAVQRYLTADEETKAAAISRSEAWLSRRITDLRDQLDGAEQAVEDFRSTHDLATDRSRAPLQEQMLQLVSRRVTAEADFAAAKAKLENGRAAGVSGASSDALASPLIQGLRQQEAQLLTQQAQLSAVMLGNQPSMIQIAQQLAQIRASIRTEVARVGRGQASNTAVAAQNVVDINTQIDELQTRINNANAADIRLRSLEADVTAKRAVLNNFAERYDQDAGSPLTSPDGRVVSWASVPVDESAPKYKLVLAGGTLAFVVLGFATSLVLERLRSGFAGIQELSEELGLVVAGLTAERPRRRSRRLAETPQVRELALTVRALAHASAAASAKQVVLITSALAEEGKSTLALSLARSVANSGQRCLLVDADVRKPSLHAALQVSATPGLVEVSLDGVSPRDGARRVPGEGFDFLAAGRPTQDALSPFTRGSFGQALQDLKTRYDVIVIDSAPVLLAAEGLVLSGSVDLTLFLVRWRSTPREVARKAARLLGRCSAGPCLAVLSRADLKRMRTSAGLQAQYHTPYLSA